jgi:hypothetical protein
LSAATSRPTLAVIVTYFGSAPPWLAAFFRSCETNGDVQWLLYADFAPAFPTPANVTIRRTDLRDFNARASDAVGAAIAIDHASLRKVCDFKPVYGLMFADDLRGFDWWAYSDLDVVWGDVRRFVTDDLLHTCIVVSPRQRKLGGHGTFLRNTDAVNRTFELIPDVVEQLRNPKYLRLDENILTNCLRDLIARSSFKARPKIYWEDEMTISAAYQKALIMDERDWRFEWKQGRAFDAEGREVMYLHFHKLKQYMSSIDFTFGDQPDAFTLSRKGIVSSRSHH